MVEGWLVGFVIVMAIIFVGSTIFAHYAKKRGWNQKKKVDRYGNPID